MTTHQNATMNPNSNEAMSDEGDFYRVDVEMEATPAETDSQLQPFPNFYESAAPTHLEHPLSVPQAPGHRRLPSGELSMEPTPSGMINLASPYPPPDQTHTVFKPERSSSPSKEQHRRGYQACQPCRQRKVKCDMGSVDKPDPPPCKRCQREAKRCHFAETRRKRPTEDEGTGSDDGVLRRRVTGSRGPEHIPSNIATQPQYSASPTYKNIATSSPQQWAAPPNEASLVHQHTRQPQNLHSMPTYVPSASNTSSRPEGNHMLNKDAADKLNPAIATSYEALHLLSQAATQTEKANRLSGMSPSTQYATPSTATSRLRGSSSVMSPGNLIDPAIKTGHAQSEVSESELNKALQAWARMRFVRAGWFTAREAMTYVDYYYEHLAPLTPIVPPDFRAPSKQESLLTEEPILAIAILAITSRHMQMSGPGAQSRSYSIHEKLWTYLRCMVERLLWGQEQFGGGFCGGGAVKTTESKTGQITWKGSLRTLGTIEAILLLTDWHPRALHFPPGDDENRLLDPDPAETAAKIEEDADSKVPYASWLEPAWRSDRMSWMLLGLAEALSFELGVFDRKHYTCKDQHDDMSDCARKRRVRRLVLTYVSQTSGRLGINSMLPLDQWQDDPLFDKTNHDQTRGKPTDPIDVMQECWLHIASIMYQANQKIFPSRDFTRDLISNGQYVNLIAEFRPLLQDWKASFEVVSAQLQPAMRSLLTMEYEYARLYINSLALQKMVDTWSKITKENSAGGEQGGNASSGAAVGPQLFPVLFEIYRPNKQYIDEVADAAKTILKTLVDGLGPQEHLRHVPVRTYFRTLSGLMFTLKRFSFGASEQDVRESLDILDKTTDFLSNSVVDDVHLGYQTAANVKIIAADLRTHFIRIQAPSGESREQSRHHTPQGQQEHVQEQQQMHQHGQKREALGHPMYGPRQQDPLANIQARPMTDFSNISYMPPPNYNMYMNGADLNSQYDISPSQQMITDASGMPSDWFTLPLDNILNSGQTGIVDQGFGGIGPTVGARDMLELITGDQYDQNGGWPGFVSGGYQ